MESWDDDNFEPQVIAPSTITSNKWEGEDEEENIKESWEDEDEENKPKEERPVEPAKTKTKKKMQDIVAEKEKKKREEIERRLKEEEEDEEDITPEEKLKRQKESDLNIALETTFGDTKETTDSSGLNFNASTKEELDELAESLSKKLQPLSKSTEYPAFAENLVRDLCVTLNSFDIKKIKTTIDNLYLEKQKIEKGEKTRKSKGKAKAKIKVEDANQYSAYVDDFDDYNDFM